ncbi:MAG: hypothetical protein IPL08_03305 [Saprospiraceae bacterium]|nr:hypothetical protein [Saprospiraceae bacterium]MBK8667942.1 hypothetical protein [Saprospiraceae bacterium]
MIVYLLFLRVEFEIIDQIYNYMKYLSLLLICCTYYSCGFFEKSANHAFTSGLYTESGNASRSRKKVFLDISENQIKVFDATKMSKDHAPVKVISLAGNDSICYYPSKYRTSGITLNMTTVLFKFRPSTSEVAPQLNTDFNAAIYSGWRTDSYFVNSKETPLGHCTYQIVRRSYDIGMLFGTGSTLISPFTTKSAFALEYNGMILQGGLAGSIQSSFASFGLSAGVDYLIGPQRKIWIYQQKPWIGLVVGIALN